MPEPDINVPSPDPSALTTEQLRHEISALEKLMDVRFIGVGIRLDSMDKASVVLAENVNRVPTLLDRQIAQIKELLIEKFASVKELAAAMQITSGTAISAAFAAADKQATAQQLANADSIRKSDQNFTERLKSQETLLTSTKETLSTQIGELKARLDRGEGATAGGSNARTENRLDLGSIMAMIAVAISALALVAAVTLHRG